MTARYSHRLVFLLICSLLATACQKEEPPPVAPPAPQPPAVSVGKETPTAPPPAAANPVATPSAQSAPQAAPVVASTVPVIFMEQGTSLARGETLVDALPVWRRFAAQKPALLLLSNDPALRPPPNELRPQIDSVLVNGTDAALRQAGNPLQPAPLFLPVMSVDLALRQGWLRELVWAFPLSDATQEIKLDKLREQLTGNRLANAEEAASLQLDGKVFSGRLRGAPFRAAALPNLPKIEGPVIVHIDLSYLQKLYKNEIATPVIPLVGGVATAQGTEVAGCGRDLFLQSCRRQYPLERALCR